MEMKRGIGGNWKSERLAFLSNCLQQIAKIPLCKDKCSKSSKSRRRRIIPFRDSVITHLLKDSLISGNCRTILLCHVSPNVVHTEQTIRTLRYGSRCKYGAKRQTSVMT